MQIVCPHCNFTKEIDPSNLPGGATRATCPKCKEKFDLFPQEAKSASTRASRSATPPPPPPPSRPAGPPTPARPAVPPPPPPARPEARPSTAPPPLPSEGFRRPTGSASPAKGIPWEDRPGSFFANLWGTVKMCLFKPMEFFAAMPTSGGHGRPLVFAMILGFIGTVGAVVWQMLFSGLGMMISGGEGVGGPEVAIMGGVMIGFVIFSPLLIAIGLYIGAAVIHVLLMIFRGAGGGFEATFRVIAYTSSTQLFALVPILGGMVAGLYALVLLILGLPKAHNTDTWRAVVAVLVLPVGFVFLAIFAAILIPILISSGR